MSPLGSAITKLSPLHFNVLSSIFVAPTKGERQSATMTSGFHPMTSPLHQAAKTAFAAPKIGAHHHTAGPHLNAYATEMAWREDHRRIAMANNFG